MRHALLAIFMALILAPAAAGATNLNRAVEFFQTLDKDHMERVDQFYDRNVGFQDPVHTLTGVTAVRSYYEGLYRNATAIRFEFSKQLEVGDTVVLVWRMFLKSPALQGGREITVDGTSVIIFGGSEGKAIKHRDYFDMGEFVYERIPVLRSIIQYIKSRLAGNS